MAEKVLKQLKTSMPFPLLRYKVAVKYNEVKKASGISYILLEILLKTWNSSERISDVLLKFGIPSELHYIFGKELARLIDTEIVQSNIDIGYFKEKKYFSEIMIRDVRLTEKGKKLFADGSIPTGKEKGKIVELYFSPVTRKFDVKSDLAYMKLAACFLGEDFIDRVDVDISGMEDYLNSHLQQIGLRAEERIISVERREEERLHTRAEDGFIINIYSDRVEFVLPTSDERAFFDRYYSSALVAQGMLVKNNYKFIDGERKVLSLPSVPISELSDVDNLYIPGDCKNQSQKMCNLFLSRGRIDVKPNGSAVVIDQTLSSKLLDELGVGAEFALIVKAGVHVYSAVNVLMPCKKFDDIFELQMLTERLASYEQFERLANKLLAYYCDSKAKEGISVVAFLSEAVGGGAFLIKYSDVILFEGKNADEKIGKLLKLHDAFAKIGAWKDIFAGLGIALLKESTAEIVPNNVIYKKTVTQPLKEKLGMSDIEYVTAFAKTMKEVEDSDIVYQALETAEFDEMSILSVVNVVPEYAQAVLDGDELTALNHLAQDFNVLRVNLWKLNDMLGIKSSSDYTLSDNYDIQEFFNLYVTIDAKYKKLKKYRQYASQEFAQIDGYMELYSPIHELLSMELVASSHPEKLNKGYFDNLIARGNLKNAICDLCVKLQFDLHNLLGGDSESNNTNELIELAYTRKFIDRDQKDALHKLRICRNNLQHPTNKEISFDKKTVENWLEIVFAVGGEK